MPKQKSQYKPQENRKKDSDFDQKLLDVARVARVTAGGRRFSFRAVVVIGDRNGHVGVGVKKGRDVRFAMEKAVKDAKKNLINVPMTKDGTIPHESYGKSTSAVVFLKPAARGRGIIAGGAVRIICDLAGYDSIVGKMLSRTNNKLNNARATIKALEAIRYKPEIDKDKNKPKASAKGGSARLAERERGRAVGRNKDADSSTKKPKTKKS